MDNNDQSDKNSINYGVIFYQEPSNLVEKETNLKLMDNNDLSDKNFTNYGVILYQDPTNLV